MYSSLNEGFTYKCFCNAAKTPVIGSATNKVVSQFGVLVTLCIYRMDMMKHDMN